MIFNFKSTTKYASSFIFPLLVASSLTALSAHAATVTLENGDQITGELRQLSGSILTFKSSVFGEVKIPWEKVNKLISDDGVRIQLSDGKVVDGQLTMDGTGNVIIDQDRLGQSSNLTRRDLAALNPPVIDNSTKYAGRIDLGGSFNRGNSTGQQLNAHGELVARTPQDRYTAAMDVNEAKSGGVKTASNWRLLTQYDAFLDDKNFLFVNAKAESDELADLKLRTSLGAGYGRQFIDTDIAKLSGQIGLNYVNEDYEDSPDQSFPTLSLGMKYDRSFFDKQLVYFQNANLDVSLEDAQDALLHTSLGLRVPVAHGVSVSGQLNVDYDNQPADGAKTTDTAVVFSVGYGF